MTYKKKKILKNHLSYYCPRITPNNSKKFIKDLKRNTSKDKEDFLALNITLKRAGMIVVPH